MPSSPPFPQHSTGSFPQSPSSGSENSVNSLSFVSFVSFVSIVSTLDYSATVCFPQTGAGGGGPEDAEVLLPRGDRGQAGGGPTGGGGRDGTDGGNVSYRDLPWSQTMPCQEKRKKKLFFKRVRNI